MKIVVIATDELRSELSAQGIREAVTVDWVSDIARVADHDADVCIDLLFPENPGERMTLLKQYPFKLVLVNDVAGAGENLPEWFIRINGWPGFLKRVVIEAAGKQETNQLFAAEVVACFNKRIEWTTDEPGFITARIVSMIINEAYFALGEQVSTKDEIDIAMKTGTLYPYGPFEWCDLIGVKNVHGLLHKLSKADSRYQSAELLTTEVDS
jgi:3-hydroxybutyryl-CoA dehydrogenase